MTLNLKKNQNYFFVLPGILVALSVLALIFWGLKPNIELSGGSLIQIEYPNGRPAVETVMEQLDHLSLGEAVVQPSGDNGYIIRQRVLSVDEKSNLDTALASLGQVEEVRHTSVGPSIGSELVRKAWWAIGLVILSIIIYIAFAFRGVGNASEGGVPSWKYGVVAIITLVHDVIIPIGLYAYLGYAHGAEIGTLFIVALLTILGVSINDTIVIFDRIRENLAINSSKNLHEPYADVVWKSIKQTLARSVNTSLTVIMMLLALVFLGPESTRELAITLTVGMIAGTYSSIFLASPLLVLIEKYQKPAKAIVK